jgi:uridine kinase
MNPRAPIKLVAIAGGSGAGKTWLAEKLQAVLGERVARLSLDDFYLDRSDVPPAEREKIDFDDPCAMDWPCVERVLRDCRAGRPMFVPHYEFRTHTRRPKPEPWQPAPLVLMDGLWLLLLPVIRRRFDLRIFVDCPEELRLQRRLARDVRDRGRSEASVGRQFHLTVAPMHARYVARQSAWADMVVDQPIEDATVRALAELMWCLVVSDPRWMAPSRFVPGGDSRSPARLSVARRVRHPAELPEATVGV